MNESKDGIIYIAFGTSIPLSGFPEETILSFYTSLAKIAPVRVLMKLSKKGTIPPGIPINVLTKDWIPQISVLSKVFVIIKTKNILI